MLEIQKCRKNRKGPHVVLSVDSTVNLLKNDALSSSSYLLKSLSAFMLTCLSSALAKGISISESATHTVFSFFSGKDKY